MRRKPNKLGVICTISLWMHPHTISSTQACGLRSQLIWGLSGARVCQPLSTATCMRFLGMKTTVHPLSRDLSCQTIPYSYTRPFQNSSDTSVPITPQSQQVRADEKEAMPLWHKSNYYKRERDKCLKDLSLSMIYIPSWRRRANSQKRVHVANNTLRWFLE